MCQFPVSLEQELPIGRLLQQNIGALSVTLAKGGSQMTCAFWEMEAFKAQTKTSEVSRWADIGWGACHWE
jgi:hypothetical protein